MGGDGNDQLDGSGGADTLTGGNGADRFHYDLASDSLPTARDVITDFASGTDKLDFSDFDANTAKAQVQHFSFIGGGPLPARVASCASSRVPPAISRPTPTATRWPTW